MKYLLLGDEDKALFIEDDEQLFSIKYDPKSETWYPSNNELWNNRVGFDSSEPIDSPYRYGNSGCMRPIIEITHEEAEAFISRKIDDKAVKRLLRQTKRMNYIYD